MGHSCWQVQRPPRTRALLGSENSRPLTFQGVKSRGLVVGEGRSELELPDSRSETELLSHITSHTVQAGFVRACDRLHLSASFLELLGLGEGEAAKGWTARRNGASWNFSHFSVTAVPIFLPSRRFHHTQLSRGSRARTHTHTRTHSLARSLALSALSLSLSLPHSQSLALTLSHSVLPPLARALAHVCTIIVRIIYRVRRSEGERDTRTNGLLYITAANCCCSPLMCRAQFRGSTPGSWNLSVRGRT